MKKLDETTLEGIIEIAKNAGYKPTGNVVEDVATEHMLIRFAYRIEHHIRGTNS